MALSISNPAALRPEIKLGQVLSEFEAILTEDQKTTLRTYRGQSPPSPDDVMWFTAQIDRNASRESRQCVGTRLSYVLHSIQQYSGIMRLLFGTSHPHLASAIWGTVKISLEVMVIPVLLNLILC